MKKNKIIIYFGSLTIASIAIVATSIAYGTKNLKQQDSSKLLVNKNNKIIESLSINEAEEKDRNNFSQISFATETQSTKSKIQSRTTVVEQEDKKELDAFPDQFRKLQGNKFYTNDKVTKNDFVNVKNGQQFLRLISLKSNDGKFKTVYETIKNLLNTTTSFSFGKKVLMVLKKIIEFF